MHICACVFMCVCACIYVCISKCVKPSSQYIAHDASRPEVIIFSMGFDASQHRIESISIPASRHIQNPLKNKKIPGMRAIYCELGFSVCRSGVKNRHMYNGVNVPLFVSREKQT